jgi:hypothetical protein
MDDFLKYLLAGLVIVAVMLVVFNTDWSYAGAATSTVYAESVSNTTKIVQEYKPVYQSKTIMEKAGPVLVGQASEEVFDTRTFDFDTNYLRDFNQFYVRSASLYSGLMFGNNDLSYDFEYPTEVHVEFDVASTNHIAPLIISVNGNIVSSEFYTKGSYSVDIPKEMLPKGKATVSMMAGSSSWKLWAPAIYNITDVRIMEKSMYEKSVEYPFYLQQKNYESARLELHLVKNSGEISVSLNGHDVYSGIVSNDASINIPLEYLGSENSIKIKAMPSSEFSGAAKLITFYRKRTNENRQMVASFDVPTDSYEYLKTGGTGTIRFIVYHVDENGIVNVKIMSGDNILYNQYEQAAGGEHLMKIDSRDIAQGGNRLIISAADSGLFTVKDVSVSV